MLHEAPPLRMARLRVELRPRGALRLPVEERGNVLRGALGLNLKRTVCDLDCDDVQKCPRHCGCAYARLFEPVLPYGAPFGARDAPRPFLFRPPLDPDPHFGPQRPFIFELRLFGRAIAEAAHFVLPLLRLDRSGLAGPPVDVVSIHSLDWMGRPVSALVDAGRVRDATPAALDFDWCVRMPGDGPRARIEFVTPTRVPMRDRSGSRDGDSSAPSMAALARRIRDRISLLSLIWAGRAWAADYGAIGDLADRAAGASRDGRAVTFIRHSTKTGRTIHMSGYRGTVAYDNVDDALWPLLRIGQEIHAGRFTEWGLGLYRLQA